MDIVTAEVRSRMMSRIRSKDTGPERAVRRYLHSRGFRYRLHVKELPGTPDIVLPKYRTVVFVHGCFWHRHSRCRFAYEPRTHAEFWRQKLDANVARDLKHTALLRSLGWKVEVVWECQAGTHAVDELIARIASRQDC